MSILVTASNSIKALIVTRTLGKKGINIYNAEETKKSLSSYSKFSKGSFTYCSPKISENKFIEDIIDLIEKLKIEVLMPVHSRDTYIISKYKKKLETYVKVPFPNYDQTLQVNDKGNLMKLSEKLIINIPKTYYYEDYKDISNFANNIKYPVVIKLKNKTSSVGLSYAYSKKDMIRKYKETINEFNIKNEYECPLIQQYIKGNAYGVSLLYNKGELRAKFVHKRIREYPITGGPSTYRIA